MGLTLVIANYVGGKQRSKHEKSEVEASFLLRIHVWVWLVLIFRNKHANMKTHVPSLHESYALVRQSISKRPRENISVVVVNLDQGVYPTFEKILSPAFVDKQVE
jgi:hypothetical protein